MAGRSRKSQKVEAGSAEEVVPEIDGEVFAKMGPKVEPYFERSHKRGTVFEPVMTSAKEDVDWTRGVLGSGKAEKLTRKEAPSDSAFAMLQYALENKKEFFSLAARYMAKGADSDAGRGSSGPVDGLLNELEAVSVRLQEAAS